MFDIKIVQGRTKKEALDNAKMDYGDNFTILRDKVVKTGGILGIGQKEMYQVSIALFDNKFKNDTKEIKKHEPIDGEKIAEGILNIRKNILQSGTFEKGSVSNSNQDYIDDSNDNISTDENISVVENITDINIDTTDNSNTNNSGYKSIYNHDLRAYRNKPVVPNAQNTNAYSANKADKINNALSSIRNVREQTSLTTNKSIYKYIDSKIDGIEDKIEDKMRSILTELFQQTDMGTNGSAIASHGFKALPSDGIIENNNNGIGGYKVYNKDIAHSNTYKIKRKSNKTEEESVLLENDPSVLENNVQDDEVYLEVDKQKLKNKNSVIDSVLEKVKKKEFPDELIEDIRKYLITSSNVRFIQSESVVRDEISRYFDEKMVLQNGIQLSNRKKIVILVGPTGVGKTTTIPKLAAPHIRAKRDVCFITLDNYRIAAEEQLAKYASIIKIPFATVKTPDSLRNEVRKMSANSVLFIDTIGRSPKATKDIIEMSKYFSSIGRFDIDINILLSATLKYSDALNILDKFSVTNYKSSIITKLDETNHLAPVVGALIKNKVPISSITYGQSVPNDISDAVKGKNRIMKAIYGGSTKC